MNLRVFVKQILIEREEKRYKELLAQKRGTYGQWLFGMQKERIIEKRKRFGKKRGKYVCCVFSEGRLAKNAISILREQFEKNSEVLIFYGDEDVWSKGQEEPENPWFKPVWSPDLLDSFFYFGSVTAIREELWEKAVQEMPQTGLKKSFVQQNTKVFVVEDRDLYQKFVYYCVSLAGGYQKSCRTIGHIPEILFHCHSQKIQEQYLEDRKVVSPSYIGEKISVIIPSKDNADILEQCLKALPKAAGKEPYEVIIVDNGSSLEQQEKIKVVLEKQSALGQDINWIYQPMKFHFSKMCNLGAKLAKGKHFLFLNDDVELVYENTLSLLAELSQKEYVGAVGIKLYYPDSVTIQHIGVANLPLGPVHKLRLLEDDKDYYFKSSQGLHNMLAVTGACLMVAKEKFEEIGGFSEELPVNFNDVDFCFQLYKAGYQNVCRNDIYAYHYESLSRGNEISPEKLQQIGRERSKLYELHPTFEDRDPYYSIYLEREETDAYIRTNVGSAVSCEQKAEKTLPIKDLRKYRFDNIILFKVEDIRNNRIRGYGVVLGDNNACYERELLFGLEKPDNLLKKEENGQVYQGVTAEVYSCKIEGQYRPDLIKNLPDQKNVGLGGFYINVSELQLPRGKYRIGIAAKNRVARVKLVNWSEQFVYF